MGARLFPTEIHVRHCNALLVPQHGLARMREGQKLELARSLRHGMTDAERHLWKYLRQRQVSGCKFRRQVAVGPYIADFACFEKGLIVEVDGGQHCDSRTDLLRDVFLRRQGFKVLRFWNHDVLANIGGVVWVIAKMLATCSPHPNPPPQAGEGA